MSEGENTNSEGGKSVKKATLATKITKQRKGNIKPEPLGNGVIHVTSKLLKNVVASAAESEIGGLFENTREGLHMRQTLIALKHPQPPTPIQTDNKTAQVIINNNAK